MASCVKYLDAIHEEVAFSSADKEAVVECPDVLDGEGQLEKLVDAVRGVHDGGCAGLVEGYCSLTPDSEAVDGTDRAFSEGCPSHSETHLSSNFNDYDHEFGRAGHAYFMHS